MNYIRVSCRVVPFSTYPSHRASPAAPLCAHRQPALCAGAGPFCNSSISLPSRAVPSRAEPSRAEPSRAEPRSKWARHQILRTCRCRPNLARIPGRQARQTVPGRTAAAVAAVAAAEAAASRGARAGQRGPAPQQLGPIISLIYIQIRGSSRGKTG